MIDLTTVFDPDINTVIIVVLLGLVIRISNTLAKLEQRLKDLLGGD